MGRDKLDEPIKSEHSSRKHQLLVGAAAMLLSVFLYTHWTVHHPSVPGEIVGTWTTNDGPYAGRTFEIAPETVNFGTGKGRVSTGFIYNVQAVPDGAKVFYTLSYTVNGSREHVSFYYDRSGDKAIRFQHQDGVVWVKTEGG
jgi:hypothetical protein